MVAHSLAGDWIIPPLHLGLRVLLHGPLPHPTWDCHFCNRSSLAPSHSISPLDYEERCPHQKSRYRRLKSRLNS